jgi:hypothetical protein
VGRRKLTLLISIFLLIALALASHAGRKIWQRRVLGTESGEKYLLLKNSPVNPLIIDQTINLGKQKQVASVYHLFDSISGLAIIDYKNNFLEWLPEGEILSSRFHRWSPGDHLDWFRLDNLDSNRELLVQYTNTGTAGVHPFYLYSYDGNKFELLLKLVNPSSKTEIGDLDGDGNQEIIHEFSLSGSGKLERDLLRWKDIWRLEDGKPVKVNQQFPQEYQELVDLYRVALTKREWEPDAKPYYPILRCLEEKAELTMQGKLVEIKECRELLRKRHE